MDGRIQKFNPGIIHFALGFAPTVNALSSIVYKEKIYIDLNQGWARVHDAI